MCFDIIIDNFNIKIENYNLRIPINLIIFNKELNIIYNTKNININDVNKLNDTIIIDYIENNYLFYDVLNVKVFHLIPQMLIRLIKEQTHVGPCGPSYIYVYCLSKQEFENSLNVIKDTR